MATKRKPQETRPEIYPEVDAELMAMVYSIYRRWTPEQFGHAIWQYRREHDLIQQREKLKQQLEEIAQELEDLE